jgi:hypothetical protein
MAGLSALVLLFSLTACGGQNGRPEMGQVIEADFSQNAEGEAFIDFDTLVHDFGTIIEGERVVCYFEYQNGGDAALLINSVEATCGCTTPNWSNKPLSPGASERLEIIFDASGRSGEQRKVVTVRTNANNPEVRLSIRAHVNKSVN